MGRHRFIKWGLRSKLLSVLLLSVLCTLGISLSLTYHYSRVYMKDQAVTENERLLYQMQENVAWYFNAMETATLIPYANDSLYNALSNRYTDSSDISEYIENGLSSIRTSDDSIHQVYLYSNLLHQEYLATADGGFISRPITFDEITQLQERGLWILPTHPSSDYGISQIIDQESIPVFTLRRFLYQIPENRYMGFLDINIDLSYFSTIFGQLTEPTEETLILLDDAGNIIFSAGNPEYTLDYPSLMEGDATSGNFSYTKQDVNEPCMVFFQKLERLEHHWTLVKLIPHSVLYRQATRLVMLNLLVGLACLLVAAIIMVYVSYRFTVPINRLVRHIKRIESGDMHDQLEIVRSDEIGDLARQFSLMMDHINNLVLKGYQMELANKTYQLKALQAQLDPHFINNTIQSIGTVALQAKAFKVYDLLSSFGAMMRYSIDMEHLVVPLEKEIEQVRWYLELLSERFAGVFTYTIDAENAALDMDVPKMVLQPIVENVFKHGRIQERSNGRLSVIATLDGDMLLLVVEDNGVGMPEEELHQLRRQTDEARDTLYVAGTNHIGLRNLATRLKLYYGDNASLSFGNKSDEGFYVQVRMIGSVKEIWNETPNR
ncbi:MAG: sensor histidine kinase [Sphaerochaetaceae bacterium]